jgi:lipoprotein-anchoring transpeptidase ErfK/SrfK
MNRICPIGSIPYEIKSGDTLGSIATYYMTTEETLLETNPDINPNNLKVGQIICITQQKPDVSHCPSMNVYVVNKGDTFVTIASKFGISIQSLLKVNPQVDPHNMMIDTIICLPLTPTPYIIVIDTTNKVLNLYFLGRFSKAYKIAIGYPKTPTPKGYFHISNKQVNPGGPFGSRWMGLSNPHYGIHGTNRPDSIGKAITNGCIRLHNRDVEELFSKVSVNTPVIIK